MTPGVWITGPSRSGTSMMAGLFHAHGVFFGDCIPPNRFNRKGFFENVYLKEVLRGLEPDWPVAWWTEFTSQGWDGRQPWGVKCGPKRAGIILPLEPAVVVVCRRPIDEIASSRERVPWAKGSARGVPLGEYVAADDLHGLASMPVVDVRTDRVAAHDFTGLAEVFDHLGVHFDDGVARAWVEPLMWGGR